MATISKDLASYLDDHRATASTSVVPKTPQDFVLQAQTYLMAMNPAKDDPRHDFHNARPKLSMGIAKLEGNATGHSRIESGTINKVKGKQHS
jgi:hypothetical protein